MVSITGFASGVSFLVGSWLGWIGSSFLTTLHEIETLNSFLTLLICLLCSDNDSGESDVTRGKGYVARGKFDFKGTCSHSKTIAGYTMSNKENF